MYKFVSTFFFSYTFTEMTRMKDEPNHQEQQLWYEQDAMSVNSNSAPTSPESERKKTNSESMSSDKGDKEYRGTKKIEYI